MEEREGWMFRLSCSPLLLQFLYKTVMPKGAKLAVVLFLAVATAHGIFSQEPTPPSQPQKSETEPKPQVSMEDTVSTFKLRVNLVQVHVVVRDGAGKPVGGLRKEDFQLYDNNKLQAVTTFAIEDDESRKQRGEAEAKTQLNNGETPAQIEGTVPERFVALTFDDIHLLTSDVAPMRAAANGVIDAMGPSDRVGVFTTSGVVTEDFTSNKELLKQALLKLMSRADTTGNRGACPNVSYDMAVEVLREGNTIQMTAQGAPDLSISTAFTILYEQTLACVPGLSPSAAANLVSSEVRRVADEGEAENRNVYRELVSVLRLLSSKPGERVLLLASPGFPVAGLTSESSAFIDYANRSNIVINTIDARGLYTPDLFGDIAEPYAQPAQMAGQAASILLTVQMEKQFVLGDFAYGTGGRFFHNSNELEGGLKQLGIVPEVSYMLGFSPQNEKMDGHFHALKVTLTGKQKYAILARRGYYAPKKVDDPHEAEKQEMQDAVFSRDEIFDLPLTLQTQYFKTGDGGSRLSVVSRIGLKGLRFRTADGKHFDDLNIATVIFDDNVNYLTNGGKIVQLRLLDSAFEKWCSTGLTVKSSFQLKPGKYLIRQVVRDSEGAQMAARNGMVVIPD
jgi:VWFA-related protein